MPDTCRSSPARICKPQSPPWQWSLVLRGSIKKESNLVLHLSHAGLHHHDPGNRVLVQTSFHWPFPRVPVPFQPLPQLNQHTCPIFTDSSSPVLASYFSFLELNPNPIAIWKDIRFELNPLVYFLPALVPRTGRLAGHSTNYLPLNKQTFTRTRSRTTVWASYDHSKPPRSHGTPLPQHCDWILTPEKKLNLLIFPWTFLCLPTPVFTLPFAQPFLLLTAECEPPQIKANM